MNPRCLWPRSNERLACKGLRSLGGTAPATAATRPRGKVVPLLDPEFRPPHGERPGLRGSL